MSASFLAFLIVIGGILIVLCAFRCRCIAVSIGYIGYKISIRIVRSSCMYFYSTIVKGIGLITNLGSVALLHSCYACRRQVFQGLGPVIFLGNGKGINVSIYILHIFPVSFRASGTSGAFRYLIGLFLQDEFQLLRTGLIQIILVAFPCLGNHQGGGIQGIAKDGLALCYLRDTLIGTGFAMQQIISSLFCRLCRYTADGDLHTAIFISNTCFVLCGQVGKLISPGRIFGIGDDIFSGQVH